MKQVNRRTFVKLSAFSLGVLGLMKQGGLLVADALAAAPDAGIKILKYVHEITADKLPKAAKRHVKQVQKYFGKKADIAKALNVDAKTVLPQCKYCKFYLEPNKEGYGKCKQAAKKPGQLVYKNGWCSMFNVEKKLDKLKAKMG